MRARAASRLPADLGGCGWYEILPPPREPRVLDSAILADWVVVGAGFAGLAATRRLRQLHPGDRIVLLEAQRVAWGAAGRNSGFMIDLPHELNSDNYAGASANDLKQIRMNRAAIGFALQAAEEAGLTEHADPCGKYHGAADTNGLKALRRFEAHLERLGESYSSLSAADMKRITGTGYYVGGTFTPGAVILQPAAYVRGLAEYLSSTVDVFENSPVVRFETGESHRICTPSGSVSAPRLILTNNGHLESFGYYPHTFMHIFTFASMTRPLNSREIDLLGGEPEWALIPADPMGSTIRRIRQDRIVIRNTFTYNPNLETNEDQITSVGRSHDGSFSARFPMLGNVAMQYRWGGHLCLSLNSAPAFGEIEERVWVAGCCNGLGTVKGTLGGKLIADLASGADEPLLNEMLCEPQPRKLYPEPFMTIGARAKLWWMHRRAGREL